MSYSCKSVDSFMASLVKNNSYHLSENTIFVLFCRVSFCCLYFESPSVYSDQGDDLPRFGNWDKISDKTWMTPSL